MNPCLSIRVALAVILLGGLNPAAAADPGAAAAAATPRQPETVTA